MHRDLSGPAGERQQVETYASPPPSRAVGDALSRRCARVALV